VGLSLDGDPAFPPPPPERRHNRNAHWAGHFYANEVLQMPDKFEYPWFACWDAGLQMLPTAIVDPEFAKRQLILYMREWYMHPSGALPAYEYNFDDLSPPVHAYACWRVYQITKRVSGGVADLTFLERCFHKLLLNFSFWANKKVRVALQAGSAGCSGSCWRCCCADARATELCVLRRSEIQRTR